MFYHNIVFEQRIPLQNSISTLCILIAVSQEHIGKHGRCVDYNVSKARLLHSLAKCLLELGKRFAIIFCEDLVVMALGSRFLRCHLPVVTGFRSLISSSRAGINFILPTCQVSFYVFDGKLYFIV